MHTIFEVLLNPVRMRIIQTLALVPTMTTTEISGKISDIPRATLYRHIKILLDNHILSVISEKRIRGSLERTLALNISEISKHNTLEDAAQNSFQFLMKKYVLFHNYFEDKESNPADDRIFLNTTVLMTTDDEFDQFLSELSQLLNKYRFDFKAGRKARDLSILSAPPGDENEVNQ